MRADDGNFGRPEDKDIQKEFMKRIRGNKLQAINAECQLQICLAFKDGPKESKKKGGKKPSAPPDENKITQSELSLVNISNEILNADQRVELSQKFSIYKDKWKFEEIEDGQNLPTYFFDDGCDLSYIINQFMHDESSPKQNFTAGQLIFLELLCLSGRNLLNKSIMAYYEEKMEFLYEIMKVGLDKISKKLKNYKKESDDEEMMMQEEPIESSINNSEGQKKKGKQPEKTKPIKKSNQGKKNGKKGKKSEEQEQEDDEKQEQKKDYPDEQQLAIKTCNYICWAYWYVIKK